MTKVILSFDEYVQRTNEADLFGVTTSGMGNLPPGYDDKDSYEPEDTRGIDPARHELKVIATDNNEFAILEDKSGKKYIYYFDSSQPDFQNDYLIYNEMTDDYEEPDVLGIESAANDVPKSTYGIGSIDYENPEKEIIELDEELVDDLLEEFELFVRRDHKKKSVQDALKVISAQMSQSNESEEYESDSEESETEGKPGYEESETDETTEVMEGEGIHPAVRGKLMEYLKDNPDATYPEAKKFIGEKIAGWKLSEEDFEEAKKIM
jgi:hypothetical protein